MTMKVDIEIHCEGNYDAITMHLRPAQNGFVAAFESGNRGYARLRTSNPSEIVATTPAAIKRAIMTEFETRLDAQLAELKANKADTKTGGAK